MPDSSKRLPSPEPSEVKILLDGPTGQSARGFDRTATALSRIIESSPHQFSIGIMGLGVRKDYFHEIHRTEKAVRTGQPEALSIQFGIDAVGPPRLRESYQALVKLRGEICRIRSISSPESISGQMVMYRRKWSRKTEPGFRAGRILRRSGPKKQVGPLVTLEQAYKINTVLVVNLTQLRAWARKA